MTFALHAFEPFDSQIMQLTRKETVKEKTLESGKTASYPK